MGTRIPPPKIPPFVPAGWPCSVCWGVGKTFGVDDTPSIIQVSISGTNYADDWSDRYGDPVEGIFELHQDPAVPCSFQTVGIGDQVQVLFHSDYTTISAQNQKPAGTFHGRSDFACELEVYNQLYSNFTGGSAVIQILETH